MRSEAEEAELLRDIEEMRRALREIQVFPFDERALVMAEIKFAAPPVVEQASCLPLQEFAADRCPLCDGATICTTMDGKQGRWCEPCKGITVELPEKEI